MIERFYACTSIWSVGSMQPYGIYDIVLDRVVPFMQEQARNWMLADLRAGRTSIQDVESVSNEEFGLDPDWRDKIVTHPERVILQVGKHSFMVDE